MYGMKYKARSVEAILVSFLIENSYDQGFMSISGHEIEAQYW